MQSLQHDGRNDGKKLGSESVSLELSSHDDCTITFPKKDWKLIKKALASLGMTGTFVTLTPVLAQIAGILETIDKELNESSHSNDSGTREEVQ